MESTLDDLIATICPDLDTSPGRDVYVDIAQSTISAEALGDLYDYGVALKAAHVFTIDATRPMGDGGRITAKTEGRTSVQYETSTLKTSSSDLELTQYGKRLKSLIRSLGLVADVIGGTSV